MDNNKRNVTEIDKIVGNKIKEIRKSKKISQSKLGEIIGITFQQVQKYENGTNRISISRLYDIAQALNIQIEKLISQDAINESNAEQSNEKADKFANIFASIEDENTKSSILSLIENITKK